MKTRIHTLLCISFLTSQIFAQTLSLPPGGENQKSVVTQYIGALAHVTVTYNSPDVHAPNGDDRTGAIWGQLVPYGLSNLGFGLGNPSPWRAGANENTTIEFSHDVLIEGKPLAAGLYGFHVIVEEEGPWTIIFSNNSWAWGSFFYKDSEDALRVQVDAVDHPYTEWLTFNFTDRKPNSAVLALEWENIALPFTIEVKDWQELYLTTIRQELEGQKGFSWQNWNAAANFCLNNNVNLEEGLVWADLAMSAPFIGQTNFTTIQTKANLLNALNREDEAAKVMQTALEHSSATAFQIHGYGRQLIAKGKTAEALEVFKYNYDKYDAAWPTNVGLARGYSAVGEYKKALKYAKLAYEEAPDDLNKGSMKGAIKKLENGEDIN